MTAPARRRRPMAANGSPARRRCDRACSTADSPCHRRQTHRRAGSPSATNREPYTCRGKPAGRECCRGRVGGFDVASEVIGRVPPDDVVTRWERCLRNQVSDSLARLVFHHQRDKTVFGQMKPHRHRRMRNRFRRRRHLQCGQRSQRSVCQVVTRQQFPQPDAFSASRPIQLYEGAVPRTARSSAAEWLGFRPARETPSRWARAVRDNRFPTRDRCRPIASRRLRPHADDATRGRHTPALPPRRNRSTT